MRKKKYNIGKKILAGVLAAAVALTGGAFSNIRTVSAAIKQCGSVGDGTAEAGDVAVCYEITGDEAAIVGMQYDESIDASVAVCDIPNTIEGKPVTAIKTNAFGQNMPFYKLVIPDNVVVMEENLCHLGGWYLTTMSIGRGLSDINMPIFEAYYLPLSSITVSDQNKTFASKNNAIIEKGTGTLVLGTQQTKIPNDIKSIGNYAFLAISAVKSGTSVVRGNETFCALNRDENGIFVIPDGVESIGKNSFAVGDVLTSVSTTGALCNETVFIPNTVKEIGNYAFGAKAIIMYDDSSSASFLGETFLINTTEAFIYRPDGVTGEVKGNSNVTGSKSATLYIKSKSTVATTLNGTTTSKITLPTSSDECADLNWPGHKFLGWYLDKSCKKWPITEIPKKSGGTIPVYAKWASSRTISYSTAANGGTTTAPSDITEKEDGTDIVDGDDCSFALSTDDYTASKGNSLGTWTHVGWNTDKNAHASGDGDNPSLIVDEDELLYAIFKLDIPVQFTDAQGDRNENATLWNTDTSGTLTFPSIRAKSGWDAVGWTTSTTADAETAANVKQAGDTAAITQKGLHYYALYKRTVYIDKDGDGTWDESEDEYATWPKPDSPDGITAPDKPEDKPGYNFDGWVPNPNPDGVDPVKPGGTIQPGEDGITAVFTPVSYSVNFHANNQTTDTRMQTLTYDKDAALDANTFTYSGYHFDGWATSAASTTVTYKDRQNVKNLTATANATIDLYAVWTKDSGSGNPTPSPTASSEPTASPIPTETASPVPTASAKPTATVSPVPTTSSTPTATTSPVPTTSPTPTATASPVPTTSPTPTATASLTPTVSPVPTTYNINYELNGGSFTIMPETSYTAGKTTILPIVNMVIRDGYIFDGWYDNKYFAGEPVISVGQSDKGDVTFYAKWTAKMYSVMLYLNGGKLDTDSHFLYGYGEFILPTPTKENCSFEGWYDNADFSGETFSKVTISDSDKAYYAKWKSSPSGNIELKPGDSPTGNDIPPVGTTITHGTGVYIVNTGNNDEPSVTYKVTSSDPNLVIPDTINVNGIIYKVTAISPSLIKNKSILKSVKIGKYVKRIPNNMFAGCRALTKVTGGKNVAVIGKNAFKNCVKLNKVSVFSNKKLTKIGKNAFLNCKKLKSVTIGPKVTSVQSGAFKGCVNLKKVVMKSKKLKVIDKDTFMNCKKLKSITIRSKVSSIRKNAFKGCKSLKKIIIKSKKLKTVGENALKGIHKKCRIKVPASKFSRYKKLLKNKEQKKSVKILK